MSIRLHTLGELRVFREGEEVKNLRTWKSRLGLLIYLTYHGESTRDHLTGVFWPEKPEQKARSSLSTAVSDLRKACGKDCILTQGEMYWVSEEVELDALLFQQAVEQGEFERALQQYQGPFLSGLSLVQTSAFQHWVGSVHSRLTGLHRKARSSQIEALTEAGQIADALVHARRWVELESEDDGPVQLTMKLLARDGRKAEALQQFETFRRALKMQDEEPLEETAELADRIRSGEEVGPVQTLDVESPRVSRPRVEAAGKPAPPTEGLGTWVRPTPGERSAHLLERPWVVELAETMKDWWVFRGVLAFFTFSALAIGVADGLGVPPVTVRQLLAVAVGSLVLIAPSMWAVEPWLRQRLGFGPPRTWRERPKDPTRGLWQRRGLLISGAGAVGVVIAVALWPRTPASAGGSEVAAMRTSLAFLPLLPADTSDAELGYLAEEVSQATIAHFRPFDALDVPSWRQVAGYRDPTLPPDSILNELGVDYFLSGVLSVDGDSIRLRWDLEDGLTAGEQIDITVAGGIGADRVAVLKNIVGQITEPLRRKLGEVIVRRELRLGSENAVAWAAYEEARRASNGIIGLIRPDLAQAVWTARQADSLCHLAATLDPGWAEPLILRAENARRWAAIGVFAEEEDIPPAPDTDERATLGQMAIDHLDEAFRRDSGNRDGLFLRASLLSDWDFYFERLDPQTQEAFLRRAEQDLQTAARGSPPHSESMGMLSIIMARDRRDFVQARNLGEEALRQDPWLEARRDVMYWLAQSLFELGEDEGALTRCADAAHRGTADAGTAWMLAECQIMVMALGELEQPSPDSAWALLESTVLRPEVDSRTRGPEATSQYIPRGLILYAGVLEAAGRPDSARAVLGQIETIEPGQLSAGILARLGQEEMAYDRLLTFLRDTERTDLDPFLDSRILRFLRGYPPFDSLRASSNGGR